MKEKQGEIDFLFLELHIVRGMSEILVKIDQIGGLARLQENHPLIEDIIPATIRLIQRLQNELDLKKKMIADKEKQQILLSQKISMQNCIEALTREPVDLDSARSATTQVLDLAPQNAKRSR